MQMSTSRCGHKLAVVTRLRFCASPPPLNCHLPGPVILRLLLLLLLAFVALSLSSLTSPTMRNYNYLIARINVTTERVFFFFGPAECRVLPGHYHHNQKKQQKKTKKLFVIHLFFFFFAMIQNSQSFSSMCQKGKILSPELIHTVTSGNYVPIGFFNTNPCNSTFSLLAGTFFLLFPNTQGFISFVPNRTGNNTPPADVRRHNFSLYCNIEKKRQPSVA